MYEGCPRNPGRVGLYGGFTAFGFTGAHAYFPLLVRLASRPKGPAAPVVEKLPVVNLVANLAGVR
jgi:hypothetical protein